MQVLRFRRATTAVERINHQHAYSDDGACTNQAESFFSRLRRPRSEPTTKSAVAIVAPMRRRWILRDATGWPRPAHFAVVLEKIPEALARLITEQVAIPTIGIGASPACDGQILVVDDMLGLFGAFRPRFVKRYAELGSDAEAAIAAYAKEVRDRSFPTADHVFGHEPGPVSGGEAL